MTHTIFRLVVVTTLMTAAAVGQTAAINGEITETVLDPSGAPIANATVKAMNSGTGYQRTTTTTSTGLYRLPVLPLGEYSLTVEADGFALYRQSGITLNAGSTATVDAKLQSHGHYDGGRRDVGLADRRSGPYGSGEHALFKCSVEPTAGFAQSVQLHSSAAERKRS